LLSLEFIDFQQEFRQLKIIVKIIPIEKLDISMINSEINFFSSGIYLKLMQDLTLSFMNIFQTKSTTIFIFQYQIICLDNY